jgi:hypothetical protein
MRATENVTAFENNEKPIIDLLDRHLASAIDLQLRLRSALWNFEDPRLAETLELGTTKSSPGSTRPPFRASTCGPSARPGPRAKHHHQPGDSPRRRHRAAARPCHRGHPTRCGHRQPAHAAPANRAGEVDVPPESGQDPQQKKVPMRCAADQWTRGRHERSSGMSECYSPVAKRMDR